MVITVHAIAKNVMGSGQKKLDFLEWIACDFFWDELQR